MKILGLLAIALFGYQVQASTIDEINQRVELNFERSVDFGHHHHKDHHHLNIVREEVIFPSGRQYNRLEKAIDILDEVLNSEEFKKQVTTYVQPDGTKNYQKNYLWHDETKRLSRQDVYNIIMEGNERMRPGTIGEMNLNIKKYHKFWSRVIGWTAPSSSKWINVNWRFYKRYHIHQMVGNIVHEWIHLLGFLHGSEKLHQEVPYVVGQIASRIAKDILDQENKLF